ncbi:MAG: hypothetical protein HQL07_02715 [Nitrospirae bacterium]|nr:hypothetical protein [Magnetococcales bacterium]HAT50703.1 hypothetical protein [Alphaproteobacteria bacterium]
MNDNTSSALNGLSDVAKVLESMPTDGATTSLLSGFSVEGIVASILFSIVGMAYTRMGRKNGPISTMLFGIALMVFPYFVTETSNIVMMGSALTILPFIVKFG